MNKSLKLLLLAGLFSVIFVSFVSAQVSIPNPLNVWDLRTLLLNIAGGVGTLIASLSVIMIVWAGILFLTSAGKPEAINKAKAALTYAIIGIVVGISASAIAQIVLNILNGQ